MKKKGDPVIYVPPDAKINESNKDMEPPKPDYHRRQVILDREQLKEKVDRKII